jgi:hypothetical protein
MLVHFGWVGSPTPEYARQAVKAAAAVARQCEVVLHEGEAVVPSAWRRRMDEVSLRVHMRSDVQRHCILKKYGGLWLDLDVTLLADPSGWSCNWNKYTIVRMFEYSMMYGSDLIYVPVGWQGWHLVDEHIQRILWSSPSSYSLFALAGGMTKPLHAQHPELFSALNPGVMFPFDPRKITADAVVARGFQVPKPGLGDRVASALAAVGITKERVSKALGKPCGCAKRQAKLNDLGRRFGIG